MKSHLVTTSWLSRPFKWTGMSFAPHGNERSILPIFFERFGRKSYLTIERLTVKMNIYPNGDVLLRRVDPKFRIDGCILNHFLSPDEKATVPSTTVHDCKCSISEIPFILSISRYIPRFITWIIYTVKRSIGKTTKLSWAGTPPIPVENTSSVRTSSDLVDELPIRERHY